MQESSLQEFLKDIVASNKEPLQKLFFACDRSCFLFKKFWAKL